MNFFQKVDEEKSEKKDTTPSSKSQLQKKLFFI